MSPNRSVLRPLLAAMLAGAVAALALPASSVQAAPAAAPVPLPAPAQPVVLPEDLTTVPVPASVDGTGATDVSAELNAFFAALPDKSRVVLTEGATYRIEQAVVLQGKRDVLVDGNGARTITTTRGDRTRQHWRVLGGERIVIRDLTVVGANPAAGTSEEAGVRELEAQHGFNFAGTHGAELDRVTVTDVFGDFVYLGWDSGTRRWSEDVRVHHSTFLRNGRQGMALTGARRVRIDHNRIAEVRRSTFDLEPNGGETGVQDVVIEANSVGAGRLNFIAAVGTGPVDRVLVRDNVLTGRAMNSTIGSLTARRAAWTVVGNVSDTRYGNPGGGIMAFRNIDGVVVTGNTQPAQAGRGMYLVDANGACAVAVTGNVVLDGAGEVRTSTPCPTVQRVKTKRSRGGPLARVRG